MSLTGKLSYHKASLNLKRALWGDKPEGLLPENCPNFSFFLFGPGNLNYDKPQGALWAENCPNFLAVKTEVFSGKLKMIFLICVL
jgi:hypothetical protein